ARLPARLGAALARDGPAVGAGLDAWGQLDGDDLAVRAADGAEEPCRGDDLVAQLQRGLQRLQGLHPALLGADEQEVEDGDHQHEDDERPTTFHEYRTSEGADAAAILLVSTGGYRLLLPEPPGP